MHEPNCVGAGRRGVGMGMYLEFVWYVSRGRFVPRGQPTGEPGMNPPAEIVKGDFVSDARSQMNLRRGLYALTCSVYLMPFSSKASLQRCVLENFV